MIFRSKIALPFHVRKFPAASDLKSQFGQGAAQAIKEGAPGYEVFFNDQIPQSLSNWLIDKKIPFTILK